MKIKLCILTAATLGGNLAFDASGRISEVYQASGSDHIAARSPLNTARQLGEGTYAGWTYGSEGTNRQIDCTQFVVAVLEKHLGRTLNRETRNAVNIANIPELNGLSKEAAKAKLGELVEQADPRTKGVQAAIAAAGLGRAISNAEAQPGDFVQYWMKSSTGWFGHAAIVEKVYEQNGERRMKLYGAHKSINGVGSSLDENDIVIRDDADRRIYAARLN